MQNSKGKTASGNRPLRRCFSPHFFASAVILTKMNIQFFAERDIITQKSSSLLKAIRKYEKNIEEHQKKINDPRKYIPGWDNYDERLKKCLLRHWNKEIQNFEQSIAYRIKELKRRGELK